MDLMVRLQDQAKCTPTGFKTRDNRQKPLVLKELSRLWSSSGAPWQPGHFSPSNTLLIDDSPYKALCNPVIFPPSFLTGPLVSQYRSISIHPYHHSYLVICIYSSPSVHMSQCSCNQFVFTHIHVQPFDQFTSIH